MFMTGNYYCTQNGYRNIPELKRPGRGAEHQPTSRAQFANGLKVGLLLTFVLVQTFRGVTFAFYCTYIPPQISAQVCC
jgi:hypothetical protein